MLDVNIRLHNTNTNLANLLFCYLILRNAERIRGDYFDVQLSYVMSYLNIPNPVGNTENSLYFYVLSKIIEMANTEYIKIIDNDSSASDLFLIKYYPLEIRSLNTDGLSINFEVNFINSDSSNVVIISIENQLNPSDIIPFVLPHQLDRYILFPER